MRRPCIRDCAKCRRPVITGHCDLGLAVELEPHPITRTAELAYFLEGRWTFELDIHRHLVHRNRDRVKRAATRPVFAAHDCAHPVPASAHAPSPPPRQRWPGDDDLFAELEPIPF